MLEFSISDKKIINNAYKAILLNLKDYLLSYNLKNELEYSKMILDMLHKGYFSINGTIQFDNYYDYLVPPLEISEGVQVMYGICCCRHATNFVYDLLRILNFTPSLVYYWIDDPDKVWHKVNPAIQRANHQAISFSDKLIIDPANKFILQMQNNGEIKPLNLEYFDNLKNYYEDNITVVEKILRKYYMYKKLEIKRVY